jgi:hypothetical protein
VANPALILQTMLLWRGNENTLRRHCIGKCGFGQYFYYKFIFIKCLIQ